MSDVSRTAGVAGTFPVTFSQVPVSVPTLTIYSDAARTLVAVPSTALVATANPSVWTASYPATLTAGRYYLTVSAVYTTGQPAVLDQDDSLLLTAPSTSVGSMVVSLADVKAALNKTGTADDAELTRLIVAAGEEYAEWVRPLPGSHTLVLTAAPSMILPRGTVAVTGAQTSAGVPVDQSRFDLDTSSGVLYGVQARGRIRLTVTAGPLPAHHVEAIIADVAGLFAATQRGGGQTAPRFPGEGYAEPLGNNPNGLLPVVLFPRIRSLHRGSFA